MNSKHNVYYINNNNVVNNNNTCNHKTHQIIKNVTSHWSLLVQLTTQRDKQAHITYTLIEQTTSWM